MSSWNDDRLDKRDEEVKEGFARLEGQIKDGFAETDKRFARLEVRASERVAETDKRFARLEGQINANRQETTELRSEMHNGFAEVRSEMNQGVAEVRSEMSKGFAEMNSAYAALNRTLLVVAGSIIAALISTLVLALLT